MKSRISVYTSVLACAAALVIGSSRISAQVEEAGGRVVGPAGIPRLSYVQPNASSGVASEFRFGYTHDDGAEQLQRLEFLFVTNNRDDAEALFVSVEPGNGQVRVGTRGRFGGTYQYGRIGEARTIVNDFVAIDLSRSATARLNHWTYELRMHLNFVNSVWPDRQLNIIMFAVDLQNVETEYGQLGTWIIDRPSGNHAPENISVTPRNGSGRTENFRYIAGDQDGADDIEYMEFTIGNSGASWQNTMFIGVWPATNRYVLYAFGARSEGTIGATNLRNDFVRVLSTSLEKGRENRNWHFSVRLKFLPRFTGEYNIFTYVRDRTRREDGDNMTRYTITRSTSTPRGLFALPANAVVSPFESPGFPIPIRFYGLWTDLDGTDDIERLELKIAGSAGETNGIALIRFKPNDNIVDLRDDENDADSIPVAIGEAIDLDADTIKLPADTVSVSTLGNSQFGVRFAAYIKETLAGDKFVYMRATDFSGNRSPWRRVGTMVVAGGNRAPRPQSVTPAFSFGSGGFVSFKFRDADGANDIERVEVIFNTGSTANAAGGVHIVFDNRDRRLTINQDGSSASGSIDNANLNLGFSRATVNFRRSWAFHEADILNLVLNIDFHPDVFSGAKTIWLRCTDTSGRVSRWRALGGFVIQE